MVSMEERTTIKTLHMKGLSVRAIANNLGLHRNTVRKYIHDDPGELRQPKITSERVVSNPERSSWHNYHGEILKMIAQGLCGTRIFNELKDLGAKGQLSSFYEYFRWIRSNSPKKTTSRFETGPGIQAQWDWSIYRVKIGNINRKVNVILIIHGYSRYRFAIGSFDISLPTIIEALQQAFRFFGGTCNELLMDNAAQMVQNPNRKNFAWNHRFFGLMQHYNIKPVACQVRHAWTKGKVENPFRYLEEHFIKGNEFSSLNDFNDQLLIFNEKVNNRFHQGIQAVPSALFNEELQETNKLPIEPFIDPKREIRSVRNDCLVLFQRSFYSVPYPYANQKVLVGEYLSDKVIIESKNGQRIAVHDRSIKPGERIINSDHYKGLHDLHSKKTCESTFIEYYPNEMDLLDIIRNTSPKSWKSFMSSALQMTELYKKEQVLSGLKYCSSQNLLTISLLKTFLASQFDTIEVDLPPINMEAIKNINMGGVKRNLGDYARLLEDSKTMEGKNAQQ